MASKQQAHITNKVRNGQQPSQSAEQHPEMEAQLDNLTQLTRQATSALLHSPLNILQLQRTIGNRAVGKLLSNSTLTSGTLVQREIRIGPPDRFIKTIKDLPEELHKFSSLLSPLIEDTKLYGFATIDEIRILCGYPELIAILRSNSFENSAGREPLHKRLKEWMLDELNELLSTIRDEEIGESTIDIMRVLSASSKLETTYALIMKANQFLVQAHLQAFSLDKNRQVKVTDGQGDIDDQMYGYHLTKIHNLPGIAAQGLSPREGASNRGSLAMSTAEQRIGSEKTSRGVVAFGMHPSTFRPYINQFEDRRQMIEGMPMELKPIMLRFKISPQVRKSASQLLKKGKVDYMDASARNSEVAIKPEDIDVLTPEGWIHIREYITSKHSLHEMRSGDDNARMKEKWEGKTAIFNLKQLTQAGIDLYTFAQQAWKGPPNPTDVQLLENIRGHNVGTSKNITYIFRGATMQTSGNRGTWEYALSVTTTNKEGFPVWLQEYIRLYEENYAKLAQAQIGSIKKDSVIGKTESKPKSVGEDQIGKHFTKGKGDGSELNCLLDSIYQLYHNHQGSSVEGARAMRETLNQFGLVPPEGMIDIYGGAGMQIANDLNIRIQVIQSTGGGYIIHPIIGQTGRLVHLLHTPGHFDPLWPK